MELLRLGPGAAFDVDFPSFLGDDVVVAACGDLVGVGDMRGTFLMSIIFLTSNTLSEVLLTVSVSLVATGAGAGVLLGLTEAELVVDEVAPVVSDVEVVVEEL